MDDHDSEAVVVQSLLETSFVDGAFWLANSKVDGGGGIVIR